MEFKTLDELNSTLVSGKLGGLPDEITVYGVGYRQSTSTNHTMADMIQNDRRGMVTYSAIQGKGNRAKLKMKMQMGETPLDYRLALVWGFDNNMYMVPIIAKFFSKSRMGALAASGGRRREGQEIPMWKEGAEDDGRVIGDNLDVTLLRFNGNQPITGKVDTGATLCSLHATNIQINDVDGQQVCQFVHGDKRYQMAHTNTQAVKTADGGVENRPVVNFDVKANGNVYRDVAFNLNDRSGMPEPILLGQNFLEKGKFLIDPSQKTESEELDWVELEKLLGAIELPALEESVDNSKETETVVKTLLDNPNVSLADVIKHIKGQAYTTLDKIKY